MLSHWNDRQSAAFALDAFRRQMDRLFEDVVPNSPRAANPVYPTLRVSENRDAVLLRADLPGVEEKDISLVVHQNVVTLKVERKADAPEGYSPRRQERAPYAFSRSFELSVKVDSASASAELKDGILTLTLPKVAEAKPREIKVKSA